jgi:excisionase family DNA binding protein
MAKVPPDVPRLTYTVEEAAQALGIGKTLAYELVNTGEIPSILIGQKRRLVPVALLNEMIADLSRNARGRTG